MDTKESVPVKDDKGMHRRGHVGAYGKITPKRIQIIVEALEKGNTRKNACIQAGIGTTTFHEWLNKGNPEHPSFTQKRADKYRKFREAVMRAESEVESIHVENLLLHAQRDYRASVEWLKRRKPHEWGEIQRVEQTNANLNVDLSSLTDEQLDRLANGEPLTAVLQRATAIDTDWQAAG